MSEVSVTIVPEEHRSDKDSEVMMSIGMREPLFGSVEDAKKLRDALCVMFGRPGKAGKVKR